MFSQYLLLALVCAASALDLAHVGSDSSGRLVLNGTSVVVNGIEFPLPDMLSKIDALESTFGRLDALESNQISNEESMMARISSLGHKVDSLNASILNDRYQLDIIIENIFTQLSVSPTSSPSTRLPTSAPTTLSPTAVPTSRPTTSGATLLGHLELGNMYQSRDALNVHNQRCANRYGAGAHQCTQAEGIQLFSEYTRSQVCGSESYFIVNDNARWAEGYGYYYMCMQCSSGGTWATRCNGQDVPCCR